MWSQLLIASEMAQEVDSLEELEQFRQEGAMPRLLMALSPTPYTTKVNFFSFSFFLVTFLILSFFFLGNPWPQGCIPCPTRFLPLIFYWGWVQHSPHKIADFCRVLHNHAFGVFTGEILCCCNGRQPSKRNSHRVVRNKVRHVKKTRGLNFRATTQKLLSTTIGPRGRATTVNIIYDINSV